MDTQESPSGLEEIRGAAQRPAFGLVLTGGAAFGAWEVGAIRALWDVWREKHEQPPPIQVVAGTSTGALIAPFALLEAKDLDRVTRWYTSVRNEQISAASPAILLPTFMFAKYGTSLGVFGDPEAPKSSLENEVVESSRLLDDEEVFRERDLLYQNLWTALEEENSRTLERCAEVWESNKRIVVCALDFDTGTPDSANNSPSDIDATNVCESRLFRAVFASSIPPLMGPPVALTRGRCKTPHFDGGICSEAPFAELFHTAAMPPPIPLTHVIVISSYPLFPGEDVSPEFPKNPRFMDIGLRFDSLLSESNVTRETRIARAAVRLRKQKVSEQEVQQMTGLRVIDPVPVLIEVFPKKRLGWDNCEYRPDLMKKWLDDGRDVGTQIFRKALP